MKTALKYCAIVTMIASLLLLIIFFFFSVKRVSSVTLFDGDLVKGFKNFMNGLFYPTGFMILFLVFLFFGITAVIFMFGEERNKLVNITSGVSSVLMFFWFVLLLVNGTRVLNKTNYGYDSITTDVVKIYKNETEFSQADLDAYNNQVLIDHPTDFAYYMKSHTRGEYEKMLKYEADAAADLQEFNDAIDNGTITQKDYDYYLETKTKFSEASSLVEKYEAIIAKAEAERSAEENDYLARNEELYAEMKEFYEANKDWYDANSSTYNSYYKVYSSYEENAGLANDSRIKYNNNKKGLNSLVPYFCMSFVCLISGATTILWVYTKEDRD